MSKLSKCDHLFPSEIINMSNFPLLESILEIIHHGNLVSGRIKEDDSQTSSHMHHSEPLERFYFSVSKLSTFLNHPKFFGKCPGGNIKAPSYSTFVEIG